MNFKKGDYVVLLSSCDGKNCWKGQFSENFCFKLSEDCDDIFSIQIECDESGSLNGWHAVSDVSNEGINKLELRFATNREIHEYDRLGKPFDTTNYNQQDYNNNNKENYNYLIELFEKLNIK